MSRIAPHSYAVRFALLSVLTIAVVALSAQSAQPPVSGVAAQGATPTPVPGHTFSGTVTLQGRSGSFPVGVGHGIVQVTLSQGPSPYSATAGADGGFTIQGAGDGQYTITACADGYLCASRMIELSGGGVLSFLPAVQLRAGKVNGDNTVTIADVTAIIAAFGSRPSERKDGAGNWVDQNGDGVVNIQDISLVLSNFGRTSPTPWSDSGGSGLNTPPPTTPPDPATLAPPPPFGVSTTLCNAVGFLYTGAQAIQQGVAAGTIDCLRIAVLRGRVTNPQGAGLAAVRVSIQGHPEYGYTHTQADGRFDLAVNGGQLTVRFDRTGSPVVQRHVTPGWQEYASIPDVALISLDAPTTVDPASQGSTVVRGSAVTDSDGSRRATLIFPGAGAPPSPGQPAGGAVGLQPRAQVADGTSVALSTMTVRATEYTAGNVGPAAMPGELPPTSAYTYAVEFTVDEAEAAGATSVTFAQPVPFYVENFLDFPVGMAAPVGSYDRQRGVWVPEPNGRVIEIVTDTTTTVTIDADGDGDEDANDGLVALGITADERARLAQLYDAGQELWRVPVRHFSPYDINWPVVAPSGATAGPNLISAGAEPDCPCDPDLIFAENQMLAQVEPLNGTEFSLHYDSTRMPGRAESNTLTLTVSGPTVPAGLDSIELEIEVAGRTFRQSFPPNPNQSHTFTWDGKDAYGRTLQGAQPVRVRTNYRYQGVYGIPADLAASFGALPTGEIPGRPTRQLFDYPRETHTSLGGWDARAFGLGGWSLTPHHVLDAQARTLYQGDGVQRSIAGEAFNQVISTVAGGGNLPAGQVGDGGPATAAVLESPHDVAVAPDGSIFITDRVNYRIRKVAPDGTITTVAGNGQQGYSGDGGPAPAARLTFIRYIALGPDGSIYFTDQDEAANGDRIRRVAPNGIITTIAGKGSFGFSGDGGPAVDAQFSGILGLAAGPDGSLYVVDSNNRRVRKIDPAGVVTTVAGNGSFQTCLDGGNALTSGFSLLNEIVVTAAGTIYVSEFQCIHRINPDGSRQRVAGGFPSCSSASGAPALTACIRGEGLAVGQDGSLYATGNVDDRVVRVTPDGTVVRFAGDGNGIANPGGITFSGDGGPAVRSDLWDAEGIAVAPDGSVLIADTGNERIRRVGPALPGLAITDILIASQDGAEVFVFNGQGRHLRTHDALTGAVRLTFGYDNSGRLTSITDASNNVTTIQRNGAGQPAGVTSPYGQVTALGVDANGFINLITSPGNLTTTFTANAGGLITAREDRRGGDFVYQYDAQGRLTQATKADGSVVTLVRTDHADGHSVAMTVAGRTTTYRVQRLASGTIRRTVTDGAGLVTTSDTALDGSSVQILPDGTTDSIRLSPDPRWGMQAPYVSSRTVSIPGGPTATVSEARTATLSDPANRLSLATLTSTVTVNGNTWTLAYQASNRTFTETSPTDRTETVTLDSVGRVVSRATAGVSPFSATYDARGRMATLTQGTGGSARTVTFGYHASGPRNGMLANITDPLNHTTTIAYDSAGRPVSRSDAEGTVALGYDANGNITSVTLPDAGTHAFSYDGGNRISSYVPPESSGGSGTVAYAHNGDGDLTSVDRPDMAPIGYTYLAGGQLNQITLPGGGVIDSAYSPTTGHRIGISGPGGINLTLARTGELLTGEQWTGLVAMPQSVGRTYTNDLRVASVTAGGITTNLAYDDDGLLTGAGSLTLTRHAQRGQVTGTALGMVTTARTYSPLGETAASTASVGGTPVLSFSYTRDKLGRISERTETGSGPAIMETYSYDDVGRLTGVSRGVTQVAAATYDANGNRLSVTDSLGTRSATYDGADRILSQGSTTYAHNAYGERTAKTDGSGTTTYQYDAFGNLTGVTPPSGPPITYLYDGQQRRVGKRINSVLTQAWLYEDGLRPVAELDGAGNVVSRFVYGDERNVPAYVVKADVTYRIITDERGSVRLVINTATGAVAQELSYDAWGNVTEDSAEGFQPFGFAGGLYDGGTRLVHFGRRDYDPETGRWTRRDPARFVAGQTNLYQYTYGDPINWVDPSGLQAEGVGTLDYVTATVDFPTPFPGIGISVSATRDRFGNVYAGLGASAGLSPLGGAGGSVVSGHFIPNDPCLTPGETQEDRLKDFIGGWSGQISANTGLGGGYNASDNGHAIEHGMGTPGVSVGLGLSVPVGKF